VSAKRGEARSGKRQRKERVLHTRVPEGLAVDLKRLADDLRVPVSNLVRASLENAIGAMSALGRTAGDEILDLAERLPGGRDKEQRAQQGSQAAAPLAGVIGYQPLTLVRGVACSLCGRELASGESVQLGIRADGPAPAILCPGCLPRDAAPSANS
jgi:hypothetical protein